MGALTVRDGMAYVSRWEGVCGTMLYLVRGTGTSSGSTAGCSEF